MSTTDLRNAKIAQIAACPQLLRKAVEGLSDPQLDTPYRDGGWTVRQVVHHVADSHANAYLRCRWTVAEDNPTIKTYDQDRWSTFPDRQLPLEPSFKIIAGLHERWVKFFTTHPEEAWSRTAIHPERGSVTLENFLDIYSGHGANHTAQITGLRAQKGW